MYYWYIRVLPGWSWAEINFTIHVALPKWPKTSFDWFGRVDNRRLIANCPNIYVLWL